MSIKYDHQFKVEQIVINRLDRLDRLLETIDQAIKLVGYDAKIPQNNLKLLLCFEIPRIMNWKDYVKRIPKKQVNNTIETLIFLGYIKSSSETYKLTSKAKRMIQ